MEAKIGEDWGNIFFLKILKYFLLIMLSQFSVFPIFPLLSHFHLVPLKPPAFPPNLSSCPWVVHISSLSSLFPIPFFTSLHLFNAYWLCFFFPVPFPAYSSLPPPHWKPSMWYPFLWFCSCSSYCLVFVFVVCFFF